MIWLAWRQQRAHVLGALGFTAFAALALGLTRWGEAGVVGHTSYDLLTLPLLGGPLLLGAFAGAAVFAPDVERGTHALTLTQSVSPDRWWATKLLVTGVPLALCALVTGLVARWVVGGAAPSAGTSPLISPLFQAQGVVPVGYALVVFATAALLGLLRGNALLAAVGALLLHAPLALVSLLGLRRYYAPPLVVPEEQAPGQIWPVDYRRYDDLVDGEVFGRVLVGYHPDSRFWPFQFVELGIFLALAAALLAAGWWVATRRLR
ncbi:hypothetical protein [Actinosynnema pretiosum]|uniref:ABC transporter permease n=1 Tax=Actinosynnema pretiosum TaxID=42197 RepID=A0A290YYY9_9PSEU|nr:hypothetical protein [Actinosynnema pretiosum]ATE51954.1 hypothetical protein CNX65_00515 [Actinosynnema pretiosum]